MNAILEIGQPIWFWIHRKDKWEVLHGTVKEQSCPTWIIPTYTILPDDLLDIPTNYVVCARVFIFESQLEAYHSMLEHMDEEVIQRTRELRERSEELLNLELDTSRQRQTYYQLKRKEQI
jgi:hypothetical protein